MKLEEEAIILVAKVAGTIVEELKPEATPNWNYMRLQFLASLEKAWGAGREHALKGKDYSNDQT